MSRTPLVAGNWKMNHTRAAARTWCAGWRERLAAHPLPAGVGLAVAPPFTTLDAVRDGLAGLPVALAAQNMHFEAKGAFTGEVAADMLVEAGVAMVILGHSERRHVFLESDERIARKVEAARHAGLDPILCLGETEDERDAGRTEAVIESQLRRGVAGFPQLGAGLVIAYEPVWAIGTGRVASPEQVQEAHGFLRNILRSIGGTAADSVRILYGGSVTPANAAGLAALDDVDGFLVGGASLDPDSFARIAEAAVR